MKRYALFAGDTYYPLGGWSDFIGYFDSLEEAVEHARQTGPLEYDWFHVVDISEGKVKYDTIETDCISRKRK